MLVLGRRKLESVVIGDEITLSVEQICSTDDGQPLYGATVRFGFESPRYVSIYRGELCARGSGAGHAGRRPQRAQPRPGSAVEIADGLVRVRIQLPRKIPVRCNGTPTVGFDPEETPDGQAHSSTVIHRVTCYKEDRITICNNITIATLGFYRFVFSEQDAVAQGSGAT